MNKLLKFFVFIVALVGIALIAKVVLLDSWIQNSGIATQATSSVTHSSKNTKTEVKNSNYHLLTEKELLKDYLNEQHLEFKLTSDDVSYLDGKVVAIFGGGGSIGSELARQLADKKIKQLVLVDNHENSLSDIKREMKDRMPNTELVCCLGDIRSKKTLESIFTTYKPNVIFHYANYKSVDMGFIAPKEFFDVNVIGTINLLEVACSHNSVERFVYVSSVRAQNPTEPYGRTKRIDELLVKTFANARSNIKFGSIRCSTVLDSAGSYAIPIFRKQILKGEIVNIKKVENGDIPERYFISCDMAAKLAIKAGKECSNGEVFSLDGDKIKPIKIDDLIKLIAKEYGVVNVDEWFAKNIKFVKGDPGEKNKKLPSSANGDGAVLDAPIMKLSIVCDETVLKNFLKRILSVDVDLSDKEIGMFLSEILDDGGNLPRISK